MIDGDGWVITTDRTGMFATHRLNPGKPYRLDHASGQVSDGYHTFEELYRYRMLYNAAWFNLMWAGEEVREHPRFDIHKSWRHSDGELCFGGGWFIVMATLPTGQISNHYPGGDWDLFRIPEQERADEYDGHTPAEAADRLERFLRGGL